MKICSYQTERGARAYALELEASTRKYDFAPCPHPYSFAWSVAVYDPATGKRVAYAAKRPRGGPREQPAVQPLNTFN